MKLHYMPEFRLQVLQTNFANFISANSLAPAEMDESRADEALAWFTECSTTIRQRNHARSIKVWPLLSEPDPSGFEIRLSWLSEEKKVAALATTMTELGSCILGPGNLTGIATANKMRMRIAGPAQKQKFFHWYI